MVHFTAVLNPGTVDVCCLLVALLISGLKGIKRLFIMPLGNLCATRKQA